MSYSCFSGFLSHKIEISRKKIFWALPWENLGLLMWPKSPVSSYFGQNSEMQNCQDYTDPTVPEEYTPPYEIFSMYFIEE